MRRATAIRALLVSCSCLALGCSGARVAHTKETQPAEPTEDLHVLLQRARGREVSYRPPQAEELGKIFQAGCALFRRLTTGRDDGALALFQAAHFRLTRTELAFGPAIAIHEEEGTLRGAGVYVFRLGPLPRERLVQVPHSFTDVGTLKIGIDLANATRSRALMVNSVPRQAHGKSTATGDEHGSSAPADLAHQKLTFFQQLTLAALFTLPGLQVLQVHGFTDGSLPESPRAAVVVSPGAATAGSSEAAQVAERLARLLGRDRVLLYPRDTRRFGARSNQQGRAVATNSGATFLHLELSRTLRDQLTKDALLRRAFAFAVAGIEVGQP